VNRFDNNLNYGYNLKAKHVIHTVGPVWQGGKDKESELLSYCYKNSLLLCEEYSLKTIAFPCISTGIYSFHNKEAAEIAVMAVNNFLQQNTTIEKVIFCCYLKKDLDIYNQLLYPNFIQKITNKLLKF
jgi:O-acetyl-ADP-ribose deacetylase (regulator of RNase III)